MIVYYKIAIKYVRYIPNYIRYNLIIQYSYSLLYIYVLYKISIKYLQYFNIFAICNNVAFIISYPVVPYTSNISNPVFGGEYNAHAFDRGIAIDTIFAIVFVLPSRNSIRILTSFIF